MSLEDSLRSSRTVASRLRSWGAGLVLAGASVIGACGGTTPNTAPLVRLDSVPSIVNSGSSVGVSGTASDPDGFVDRVEFSLDGLVVVDRDAPYEASLTAPSGAGTYEVRMRAFDDKGASSSDSRSLEVLACTGNPAVEYWDLLGGSAGVDVSALGDDCEVSANDAWMMDFVHSQQTLADPDPKMSDDIANMFFADTIRYHTGVAIDGFGANGEIDDAERQVVFDYYFGEDNPVSPTGKGNVGLIELREMYDDVSWFVAPPSIGILADPVRALPEARMPGIGSDLGVNSRFAPNEASTGWGSYDFDVGPERVSDLRLYMGFESCTAVDPRDYEGEESSFDRLVNKVYFEDRGLPVDFPVQSLVPGDDQVVSAVVSIRPDDPVFDDTLIIIDASLPSSLRHEALYVRMAHNDERDFFVSEGDVIEGSTLIAYLDRDPGSVLSDIKVYTSTLHTGIKYGGINPWSDFEILALFAYDEQNPHAYAGLRDPRFNLPLEADAYGNITASEPIFGNECYTQDTTGVPLRWETSISGPLSWYEND